MVAAHYTRYRYMALLMAFTQIGCASTLVQIHVVDGETNKPIAGATINVRYRESWFYRLPDDTARTDACGTATMSIKTYDGGQCYLQATAKHYLRGGQYEQCLYLAPAPTEFTLELFAEPLPDVVLVVPKGFRGWFNVTAQVLPTPEPSHRGERLIKLPVHGGETIDLTGIPVGVIDDSHGRGPGEFRVIYTDGIQVPGPNFLGKDVFGRVWLYPEDSDVVCRLLGSNGFWRRPSFPMISSDYYVIGDASDAKAKADQLMSLLGSDFVAAGVPRGVQRVHY